MVGGACLQSVKPSLINGGRGKVLGGRPPHSGVSWEAVLLASVPRGPQNERDPWSDPAWQFLCKTGPVCSEASHPQGGKRWAASLTNILVFGSHSQLSFNTQTAFPIANWQQRAHQHLNKRLVNASVRQVCMPRLAKVSCQGFSKREFL